MDKYYMMCERKGVQEFTPYEPLPDGGVNIIYGMCLITSLENVIAGGALKVVQVDDPYDLTNPRVFYDAAKTP
jgi:hypothetical protein